MMVEVLFQGAGTSPHPLPAARVGLTYLTYHFTETFWELDT